jgi:hypothetical protein
MQSTTVSEIASPNAFLPRADADAVTAERA